MSKFTVAGIECGPLGLGLMGLTLREEPIPDEQAFAVMERAIALGANCFNTGEFYGSNEPTANLKLLGRFFTKYPKYAERVCLSVKGALDIATRTLDGSPEGVRKSVSNCAGLLQGKKIDMFECARVDPKVPIETTMMGMVQLKEEGLIGGISLSEVGATTIKRAAEVTTISAVEIEFSMWCTEALDNGVLQTCADLGITVLAYSPLGRGFLTGQYKSREDIPKDSRKLFDQFSEENFQTNLNLASEIFKIAAKRGLTPAQLALAWIKKYEEVIPGLKIIPIPGCTTIARVEENFSSVGKLGDSEFAELNTLLNTSHPQGGRYNSNFAIQLWA
ncbi:NADP-dependent oxidoreductase domain-containing protein [Lipomyces oligophaga]|uniref:NADP-dependent oxidoreductase domain-containing protein n=1 Tax=Lipomyces oligophaga TaxID=45792 RepID=UPI0034CEE18D